MQGRTFDKNFLKSLHMAAISLEASAEQAIDDELIKHYQRLQM